MNVCLFNAGRSLSARRAFVVRCAAAALALLLLAAGRWPWPDFFLSSWLLLPSWGMPCKALTYDDESSRTSAAFDPSESSRRSASLPRSTAATTTTLNLSFPGYEASCTDDGVSADEQLRFLTVVADDDGDDAAAASAAEPLPPHVEVAYRLCCCGGARPRTECRTATKALRVPSTAAAEIFASGERAVAASSVASLDLGRALVLVTGCSADHFDESLVLVNSIQTHFRCARLLYWDLGLTAEQADRVRSLCGVQYRRFDFAKYPEHVRALKTYAFKPLVVKETLAEHRALWWLDASVRFTSARVERVLRLASKRRGLVLFREPTHSVWSTTHAQMYDYIATDEAGLQRTVTATGASFLVVNTRELFATVLRWFYACALDSRCIAPVAYPAPCDVRGPAEFAGCHRFDQSLLTVLAANVWGFGSDGYRFEQDMFATARSTEGGRSVRRCETSDGGG